MSGLFSSFKNKAGDGLKSCSSSASEPVEMRFTIQPTPGESGFSQWVAAMKMVAQLPGGIPPEFRRRLWITMAERHLASRGIDWSKVEKSCFSEWSHPADAELGIQIVKDLHRTGCSLFCGEDGQENQALLKKVLLAYARWNKAVGYCQGFNMLAALILQVTDRCESDALKLMIYLIEGLLPDSYFADSLRGLSVDMAVFRELLRSKLPKLSKHLDVLQNAAKDGSRSYEPPLTNVFTMQWFLTLFCNCLPQPTVLRVWDLIFLEGNEILLRTALAIWQVLAQRILIVRTADEFYCIMGALTRELLESNLIDANTLIKAIVSIGPLPELKSLRDHYLYNITPWGTSIPQPSNKQISLHPKNLDISALKKQYVKLKQRQRQAHVIFSSAISRQPASRATPVAMNHLLVGKRSLGSVKRIGPPKGSIPPVRSRVQVHPTTLHWKDTEKQASSSSSSDTELCDDDVKSSSDEETSQLPKDNANDSDIKDNPSESDIKDNKSSEEPVKEELLLGPSPVNVKVVSDSEDENEEFESFLADRVKCLKDCDVSETSATRRNSEMALQIIQENSMILHRIMQCQSRFSPSPPLIIDGAPLLDLATDPEQQKMQDVCSWIDSQDSELPVSKYRSILEKSKSLDDRYNSLFSSAVKEVFPPLGELHESKSETPIGCTVEDMLSPEICSEPNMTKRDSADTLSQTSDANFLDLNVPKRDAAESLSEICTSEPNCFVSNVPKTESEETLGKSCLASPEIPSEPNFIEFINDSKRDLEDALSKSFKSPPENSSEPNLFVSNIPKIDSEETLGKSCLASPEISSEPNFFESINDSKRDLEDSLSKFCIASLKISSERELFETNIPKCESKDLLGKSYKASPENSSEPNFFISNIPKIESEVTLGKRCKTSLEICSEFSFFEHIDIIKTDTEDTEEQKDNKSSKLIQENLDLLKAFSVNKAKEKSKRIMQENVQLLESISSNASFIEHDKDSAISLDNSTNPPSEPSLTDLNLSCDNDCSPSIKASSPNNAKSPLSPTKLHLERPLTLCDSPSKSPSKIFNPFPVPLSSRQSKEVPLKLGLYKK